MALFLFENRKAVLDRLVSIADRPMAKYNDSTYVHQVPLRQLPGIGPKMYAFPEDLQRIAGGPALALRRRLLCNQFKKRNIRLPYLFLSQVQVFLSN